MAARVLWRDARGEEGAVDLDAGEALIGRAVECAIRTDDALVSRHHARIAPHGAVYYIEDLGSANGVFYQEQRVTRQALRHGDAVRCGNLWLRFVDAAGAGAGAGPAAGAASHPTPAPAGDDAHAAPPPAAPGHASADGGDADEVRLLRRRVDQLKAELHFYRGGGQAAERLEALEDEVQTLSEERDALARRVSELEAESGDAKVRRAGEIRHRAGELVASLNDVLSNLRINVMAAEGEFEQFHDALPRASFELIREALKSSAADMETAREMMRALRELAE